MPEEGVDGFGFVAEEAEEVGEDLGFFGGGIVGDGITVADFISAVFP
jgi:hypothetical protein